MKELGRERGKMEAFMREFVPSGDGFAIFDGTSRVCHSNNIRDAQRGYNPQGCKDPQINLMVAIALKDDGIAPVFYKRYPGSIRDVSASGFCHVGDDQSPKMGTAPDGRDASNVVEMEGNSPHSRPSKALFSQKIPSFS
jgi:hypothetical protein